MLILVVGGIVHVHNNIMVIFILRSIPEVWLSYKCVGIIHVYHDDIRALLRGFDCDICRPGARFIPNYGCTLSPLTHDITIIL